MENLQKPDGLKILLVNSVVCSSEATRGWKPPGLKEQSPPGSV